MLNTQNANDSIIVPTCVVINYTYHTFTTAKYLLSTFSPIIFQIERVSHNVFLGLLLLHVNQTWYVWTRVGNKSKLLFYLCVPNEYSSNKGNVCNFSPKMVFGSEIRTFCLYGNYRHVYTLRPIFKPTEWSINIRE